MKKNVNLLLIVVMIIGILPILTGCDDGFTSDDLEGTWIYETINTQHEYVTEVLEFTKVDESTGSYSYLKTRANRWRNWDNGTYSISEEDKVILESESGNEYTYKYMDENLFHDGKKFVKEE